MAIAKKLKDKRHEQEPEVKLLNTLLELDKVRPNVSPARCVERRTAGAGWFGRPGDGAARIAYLGIMPRRVELPRNRLWANCM